ncbi:MAG: hypothetical protein CMN72_13665 [Sphingomonas sp.]|jgi:hypothetical protein|nr:hypothetical protein [Sphingomonas sp.]|tara:strand:- start:141 stop:344 length:204 start_codon:yes stop_codon:yes gene_type:complete
MLTLDSATFAATKDNPGGPVMLLVDDGVEPHGPATDAEGNVSKAGAAAYMVAYALLAGFIGYLFLAI